MKSAEANLQDKPCALSLSFSTIMGLVLLVLICLAATLSVHANDEETYENNIAKFSSRELLWQRILLRGDGCYSAELELSWFGKILVIKAPLQPNAVVEQCKTICAKQVARPRQFWATKEFKYANRRCLVEQEPTFVVLPPVLEDLGCGDVPGTQQVLCKCKGSLHVPEILKPRSELVEKKGTPKVPDDYPPDCDVDSIAKIFRENLGRPYKRFKVNFQVGEMSRMSDNDCPGFRRDHSIITNFENIYRRMTEEQKTRTREAQKIIGIQRSNQLKKEPGKLVIHPSIKTTGDAHDQADYGSGKRKHDAVSDGPSTQQPRGSSWRNSDVCGTSQHAGTSQAPGHQQMCLAANNDAQGLLRQDMAQFADLLPWQLSAYGTNPNAGPAQRSEVLSAESNLPFDLNMFPGNADEPQRDEDDNPPE